MKLLRILAPVALVSIGVACSNETEERPRTPSDGCPGGGDFPHSEWFQVEFEGGSLDEVCVARTIGRGISDAAFEGDDTGDAASDSSADAGPKCCVALCASEVNAKAGLNQVNDCSLTRSASGQVRLYCEWTQTLACV